VIGFDLKHCVEEAGGPPSPARVDVVGTAIVDAERHGEPQHTANDDDEVLEDAVMLLADGSLTLLDERLNGRKMGRAFYQKPAESLSRRIKPWGVVQVTDEREQFGERKAHWARMSTV
jgi:hypothetical protein